MKTAIVTGITGRDGSYLTEFLLEKVYEVHGIKRRVSLFNTQRIDHIYQDPHVSDPKLHLHYGDLSDTSNLTRIVQEVQPDEVCNLGALRLLKAALLAVKSGIVRGQLIRGFADEGCAMVIAKPKQAFARCGDNRGALCSPLHGLHEGPSAVPNTEASFVKPIKKVAQVIGCKTDLNFHAANHHGILYKMIENSRPIWLVRASKMVLPTLVRSLRGIA